MCCLSRASIHLRGPLSAWPLVVGLAPLRSTQRPGPTRGEKVTNFRMVQISMAIKLWLNPKSRQFWAKIWLHWPQANSCIFDRPHFFHSRVLRLGVNSIIGSRSSIIVSNWLVVWTPLKNMKVNWDDYSQYMGKQNWCSKPPTSQLQQNISMKLRQETPRNRWGISGMRAAAAAYWYLNEMHVAYATHKMRRTV